MQGQYLSKTYKIGAIFILLVSVFSTMAQNLEISSHTLVGSKNKLPFWLWANQLGRYNPNNDFTQNFEVNAFYASAIKESDFAFETGTSSGILLGIENELRLTELFGAFSWKFLELKAGAFAEDVVYNGLSASNGCRKRPRRNLEPVLTWPVKPCSRVG